jgi:RNA polymerase sigma-70 factor (ECF subfamily)
MLGVAEIEQLPVVQARAGDGAAWDALFRRYQLPLYVYIFELVRDEQTSLDIVQETFINAVRHLGSLREDGKFGSWLFGIAHQKCIQRWRKQAREEWCAMNLPVRPFSLKLRRMICSSARSRRLSL